MKLAHWPKILLIVMLCYLSISGLQSTPALAGNSPWRLRELPSQIESLLAPTAEGVSLSMQPSLFDCVLPGQVVNFTFTFSSATKTPIGGEFRITDPGGNTVLSQPFPFVPSIVPYTLGTVYTSDPIPFTVPNVPGRYTPEITIAIGPTSSFEARLSFTVRYCGNLHVLKFEDMNGNGSLDAGEPGVPNWQITVTPPAGNTVDPPAGDPFWTKLTDASGFANWDNIGLGTYTVTEAALPWWVHTTPPTVITDVVRDQTTEVRFGNQKIGNLDVCKFEDWNGNGIQDQDPGKPAEPSKSGWLMTVNPLAQTQATGADGCAHWTNIPVGNYTVTEADRSAEGWKLTTPPNPKSVTVVQGGANAPVLFGNQPQYSLTGRKTDQNGIGLAGWTIHARECNSTAPGFLTTTTDQNGNYSFSTPLLTVPPTCWTVWEEVQPGWTPISATSQDIQCTPLRSVTRNSSQRSPADLLSNMFLPFISQSTAQDPPTQAAAGCGTANFQNKSPSGKPKGIAVNLNTHRVYVGFKGVNVVYAADVDVTDPLKPFLTQVGSPIGVGNEPFGIAVNEVTNEVYVANYAGNSISVIDGNTNTVVKTISLAPYGQPTFVGIYTDTNRIYVPLHANGKLAVIDGATKTLSTTIDVGTGAFGVAIDRINSRAYVSSRDSLWITVLNIAGGIDQIIPGEQVYLRPTNQPNHYEPYALGLDTGLAQLYPVIHPYPDPPKGVNPEQAWTYSLPIQAPTSPDALTPAKAVTTVERGGEQAGVGIAVNGKTNHVFVTNFQDNSVSCFSGASLPIVSNAQRIAQTYDNLAFNLPIMTAVDPGYGYVYITNNGSGTAVLSAAVGIVLDGAGVCP